MRKTFSLSHPKHKPARVVDGIKHEVRKYLKRERRKALPDDADHWAFDCQVGVDGPERKATIPEILEAVDQASANGSETVYVEILARAAVRPPRSESNEAAPAPSEATEVGADAGVSTDADD